MTVPAPPDADEATLRASLINDATSSLLHPSLDIHQHAQQPVPHRRRSLEEMRVPPGFREAPALAHSHLLNSQQAAESERQRQRFPAQDRAAQPASLTNTSTLAPPTSRSRAGSLVRSASSEVLRIEPNYESDDDDFTSDVSPSSPHAIALAHPFVQEETFRARPPSIASSIVSNRSGHVSSCCR